MSKVKLQHYVPRFYLKNFASPNKKNHFIYCFDKITEKQFASNIRNIACEKYFYEKGDIQTLEKELSVLEKKSSRIIKKIIKTKDLNVLSSSERKLISEFIINQDFRTREAREDIKDLDRTIKREVAIKGFHMHPDKVETILDELYDENLIRNVHMNMLSKESISRLIKPVSEMVWLLYLNHTEMPFWISDNTLNRFNHLDLSPYGNMGLLSLGINIYFPINPEMSLCLLDSRVYGTYFSNNTTESITDIQHTIFQNHLQARFSYKHILSNSNDFSLLEYMLKDDPKLIRENKRVIVG